MDNANSREYLEKIRSQVIENLKRTTFAPSVQMTDVPRDSMAINDDDEAEMDDLDEDQNPDKRNTQHRFDKYVEKAGELSESEDEEMNEANGVRKQPGSRKRRNRLDYRNLNEWNGDSAMNSGAVTPQAASSIPDNDGDEDEDVRIEDAEPADKTGAGTECTASVGNGIAAASEAHSRKVGDDEEEDVAMADAGDEALPTIPVAAVPIPATAAPIPQQAVTPPDSPPNVAGMATPESSPEADPSASSSADPAIKNEIGPEDAAVTAPAAGLTEREGQEEMAKTEAAADDGSQIS